MDEGFDYRIYGYAISMHVHIKKDMMYIDLRRTAGLLWSPPYIYICRGQFEWGNS